MSRKIFDALVNLFGNHPVIIFLGMGALYFILELIEGRPFMKKVVLSSFYSFTKNTFFTVMLLSLIGAYVYQAIFVEIDKFKKAAKALDLTYHLKNHPTADSLLYSPILKKGERRYIVSPILSGRYKDVPVLLFNIRYGRTESAGESYSFYFRSVIAFSVQGLGIPAFSLLPARSRDAFSEMIFGEKAIAFEEDPEFSDRYLVKGPEKEALKQLFGPELRRAFVQSRDQWSAGVTDDHFVIFRDMKTDDRIGEDEFESYLMDAYSFYQILISISRKFDP